MITKNSSVKDLYSHPVGKDIIRKILLLLGKGDKLLRNPLIGGIKLKYLPKLTGGKLDQGFIDALLEILNGEPDIPKPDDGGELPAWWKEAVFYQVYPRSFMDSNGDGVGDLRGITQKLDYLKELGVDAIWLSPVYDSPNDDNGYDIRDYHKIMTEFGTMEDFEELLEGVHHRGMRLIMDLVVNHTSDEHEWFRKAVEAPESKYGDYYIFRDEPNNWNSFFSGSAWRWIEERGQYALHLFSQKQMDLNWDNPDVRHEVKDLVCWWLDKGVDGFRMDVINYISKRPGLPDGDELIGQLTNFTGMEHYFYGPRLHEYLRELKNRAFSPYNAFTVGETPGIGMEMSKLLTADYRGELDMVFSFDQLETPGHIRFDDYRYDLNYYKDYITDWMENYGAHCRMALFFENHDNPRMVSKVNPDPRYRFVLAKLIATMLMTLKGTPFVFQGQELGMVNRDFSSIGELRDVESLNLFTELKKSMSESDAFRKILAGSRDHARTPMQWTDGVNAGFSEAEPWIDGGRDCEICNAAEQADDDFSVLNYYRKLIRLRKGYSALIYGDISIVGKKEQDLLTYWRKDEKESFFIECNLNCEMRKRRNPPRDTVRVLGNYPDAPESLLRPYEAVVWRVAPR
ncbi:MAG: alpha-glucosidase [Oscillospiraceae bacterium]|nr:alpha-glucosidase [Oscillospiraceae bacterium]